MTRKEVVAKYGKPYQVLRADFEPPRYGQLSIPNSVDEQLIYNYPEDLRHILIYFERDKCILAVEEWSDY